MVSFADSIRAGVKRGLCSVISTVDTATALIRRKAVGDVLDDVSFPAFLNRLVCDRDMPPIAPPPFTGGQCSGVPYQFYLEYTSAQFGNVQGVVLYSCGPIGGMQEKAESDGRTIIYVTTNGPIEGGCGSVTCTSTASRSTGVWVVPGSAKMSMVQPCGGQVDNCGDPPALLKPLPPGWNTYNDNISYTNNQGSNITVPFAAVFGYADIDINGSLSIPVKVDVGGIKVDVNFNLNTGDIQFFPTNNYPSRKPGGQPTDYFPLPGIEPPGYPPNLPPQLPPINEEDKDTEEVIVAVVVTTESVETGKISTLFQDDNPSIRIPSLGHVSFLCRIGFMESAWTNDIPVKNERNLIPCPWEGGAIRVAGTPQPGVEWTLTPIYSKKNSPILFPVEETA